MGGSPEMRAHRYLKEVNSYWFTWHLALNAFFRWQLTIRSHTQPKFLLILGFNEINYHLLTLFLLPSGEHLEQLLLSAGFCLDPWQRIANLSSSAISEQRLCLSFMAFFLEFQQNSNMATIMANAKPHNRTTNTPPMFWTLNGCAFESLLLSWKKYIIKWWKKNKNLRWESFSFGFSKIILKCHSLYSVLNLC